MNKYLLILLSLSVFIGIVGGSYFIYKSYQKKNTERTVIHYLKQKDYINKIQTKESAYDSKTGEYYVEVIYKDEPNNRYNYYRNDKKVIVIGFDNNNVEITDKGKGKYIEK